MKGSKKRVRRNLVSVNKNKSDMKQNYISPNSPKNKFRAEVYLEVLPTKADEKSYETRVVCGMTISEIKHRIMAVVRECHGKCLFAGCKCWRNLATYPQFDWCEVEFWNK